MQKHTYLECNRPRRHWSTPHNVHVKNKKQYRTASLHVVMAPLAGAAAATPASSFFSRQAGLYLARYFSAVGLASSSKGHR